MNNSTDSTAHPGEVLLILLGVIAALFLLVKGFFAFCRLLTGWSILTQRFPGTDAHGLGQKFRCRGYIAALGGKTNYTIQIASEGLFIRAFFARKEPILVPWSSLKSVSETDAGFLGDVVMLEVDYEKGMGFHIPKELLEAIRGNIPADRIEKPKSLGDVIDDRLHGRSN